MAYGIMNKHRQEHFEKHHEVDMAYGVAGLGRFRVNIFSQRGTISMVFRVIPFTCPAMEDLHLPEVIKNDSPWKRAVWCWSPGPPVRESRPRWRP